MVGRRDTKKLGSVIADIAQNSRIPMKKLESIPVEKKVNFDSQLTEKILIPKIKHEIIPVTINRRIGAHSTETLNKNAQVSQ